PDRPPNSEGNSDNRQIAPGPSWSFEQYRCDTGPAGSRSMTSDESVEQINYEDLIHHEDQRRINVEDVEMHDVNSDHDDHAGPAPRDTNRQRNRRPKRAVDTNRRQNVPSAPVDFSTVRGFNAAIASIPRQLSSRDFASARDANGRRLGRNRVSKLQYQYNRNARRAEDMSLLLVSSAAAGQAETVVRTLMDRVLPARPLPSRRSKADPAPNGAGARQPKGKEPDTRQNKHVTRVDADTVPGTQGSAAGHQGGGPQQTQVAVHQVVVPEDPIPTSLVSHFATNPTPASARVIVDQLPENARAVLRFLLGNNAVTPSPPPYSSAPPPAVEHTDNTGDASVDNDEACDTYSVYEPSSPLVLPTSPTASEAVSPGNTAPVPTDPTVTVETSNSDNTPNIS
ncbi:hypothetical protein DFJ73DRAFT_894849, partial [Zopfochytrium polystomum]